MILISIKNPNPDVLVEILAGNINIRIERIMSSGQTSSEGFWYDQDKNEFVALLQGEAVLTYEDGRIKLKVGDTVVISAHKKYRVDFTGEEPLCVWLYVLYF